MEKTNNVFIATSLDGYIADENGGIAWLDTIPEINTIDTGYEAFTATIDALVMGRTTFETVLGFGIEWPYKKPVFVLSNTLTEVPEALKNHVFLVKGPLDDVLAEIHQKGFYRLYIDGGRVIQSFLKEDRIDNMIITIIPTLLGNGIPLFTDLPKKLDFECIASERFLNQIAQLHYRRKR